MVSIKSNYIQYLYKERAECSFPLVHFVDAFQVLGKSEVEPRKGTVYGFLGFQLRWAQAYECSGWGRSWTSGWIVCLARTAVYCGAPSMFGGVQWVMLSPLMGPASSVIGSVYLWQCWGTLTSVQSCPLPQNQHCKYWEHAWVIRENINAELETWLGLTHFSGYTKSNSWLCWSWWTLPSEVQ